MDRILSINNKAKKSLQFCGCFWVRKHVKCIRDPSPSWAGLCAASDVVGPNIFSSPLITPSPPSASANIGTAEVCWKGSLHQTEGCNITNSTSCMRRGLRLVKRVIFLMALHRGRRGKGKKYLVPLLRGFRGNSRHACLIPDVWQPNLVLNILRMRCIRHLTSESSKAELGVAGGRADNNASRS